MEPSTAGNRETMQQVINHQPTAAIAAAITRGQAKAEVVPQAKEESAQPEQRTMHTGINEDTAVDVNSDSDTAGI